MLLFENPVFFNPEALCREEDPDLFFPQRGASTAPARAICDRCAVRQECLDYAMEHHISNGIWGGTSGRERKALWREQRRSVA